MDAIVVEDEKTAHECIQYMREQRVGVATFIPLDSIRVKAIPERLRRLDRGARLALDCVKFNGDIQKAMQYAFGDALLCDNLEIAKDICFRRNEKLKAVALDGTIIHKSGLMTGGASDIAARARRWEEKDVEAIRKARDRLLEEMDENERQLRKLPGINDIQSEIKGHENTINLMKTDLVSISSFFLFSFS
jgi:structural maintenance of chromosome 1